MATLTSTGINCSNGTLDGYYTGSAANNTSYPIGSYLLGYQGCSNYQLNSSQVVNIPTSGTNAIVGIAGAFGGSNCAGTWRIRGGSPSTTALVQRTA